MKGSGELRINTYRFGRVKDDGLELRGPSPQLALLRICCMEVSVPLCPRTHTKNVKTGAENLPNVVETGPKGKGQTTPLVWSNARLSRTYYVEHSGSHALTGPFENQVIDTLVLAVSRWRCDMGSGDCCR
jgi:hypothetical protein